MNMKRMRGRNHRPNGGGGGGGGGGFRNQQNGTPLNRNHVFDSSGPEMRVRGTAQQLYEKYQQLARDASSSGDRVTGESYYQYAEHYFRIVSAINQAQGQPNGQTPYQNGGQNGGYQQNNRPEPGNGEMMAEPQQTDTRPEQRSQDYRPDNRHQERQETRQQEPRQQERRYEQRPYEPRNKPDYVRPERTERNDRFERAERFQPEQPAIDPRIDISSALEAELAAATAGLPGFGEQPVIPEPAPEPRAIPIIPDAPPEVQADAVSAVRVPRPRGRPRIVKPDTVE
jgi:hypothetical protein